MANDFWPVVPERAGARRPPGGSNRAWKYRLVWLALTLALDVGQFAFFPCSAMPALSLALGVPLFGALVGVPLAVIAVWCDETASKSKKYVCVFIAVVLGLGVAIPAGILLFFTHICS